MYLRLRRDLASACAKLTTASGERTACTLCAKAAKKGSTYPAHPDMPKD